MKLLLILCTLAFAEKASVKVKDIDTDKDTAIIIKKDYKQPAECVEYQVIDGNEEIFSSGEFDKSKAYTLWKDACKEWKSGVRELNKENRMVSLSCGSPKIESEGDGKYSYKSTGTYKVRVRIKEKE